MTVKCVNCGIRILNIKRHLLSEASVELVDKIKKWIYPRSISSKDLICHKCWKLNDSQEPEQQLLGHRNTCVSCGKSVQRIKSRRVIKTKMNPTETDARSVISELIHPRQIVATDEVCKACWTKVIRIVKKRTQDNHIIELNAVKVEVKVEVVDGIKEEMEETSQGVSQSNLSSDPMPFPLKTENVSPTSSIFREELEESNEHISQSQLSTSNILTPCPLKTETGSPTSSISREELEESNEYISQSQLPTSNVPTPCPLKTENVLPTMSTFPEQVEEPSQDNKKDPVLPTSSNSKDKIQLPTTRRAAATSTRCLFLDCKSNEKFCVPDSIRRRLLTDHNFYIPISTRICRYHLGSNLFEDLYIARNTLSTFNASHIEDMLVLLRTENLIDLSEPETVDDDLFKYLFGRTKVEYEEIIRQVPGINCKKMRFGLSALLCKTRTGHSNERISALFKVPRRTLEGYMNACRSILQSNDVPEYLGLKNLKP